MHRQMKIDVVHGSRNYVAVRMPVCGHSAGNVDQVHQASAQQIAQWIRVVRQYHFGHLRLRFTHRPRCQAVTDMLMTILGIRGAHTGWMFDAAGRLLHDKTTRPVWHSRPRLCLSLLTGRADYKASKQVFR